MVMSTLVNLSTANFVAKVRINGKTAVSTPASSEMAKDRERVDGSHITVINS